MQMELKHKIITDADGRPWDVVFYNKKWMTFNDLANYPKFQNRGLDYRLLFQRWNRGIRDSWVLLEPRKKTKTGNNQKTAAYIPRVKDLGKHAEKKDGEILVAFISHDFFNNLDYWQTGHVGLKEEFSVVSNSSKVYSKFPFFIQKWEILERGWIIV